VAGLCSREVEYDKGRGGMGRRRDEERRELKKRKGRL